MRENVEVRTIAVLQNSLTASSLSKLAEQLVLGDPAPFVPLVMSKRGKEIEYEAKTVSVAGRRYIVCGNHAEAAKDAASDLDPGRPGAATG
jgi:hypothetical protein